MSSDDEKLNLNEDPTLGDESNFEWTAVKVLWAIAVFIVAGKTE